MADIAEILQPDELVLDAELLPRKVKGNVAFSKDKVERFPEANEMKPPNTEAKIDLGKAVDATKPKPGIAMSKEGAKLPSVVRAEEEKKR